MKKLERKHGLQFLLLSMTAALIIFSCTGIKRKQIDSVALSKSTNQPPVTILLDSMPPAKRVDLKSAPPPRIIQVPQKVVGFYSLHTENGEEKIQLVPPVAIKAQPPIANFTNFNTEDGLALSGVFCGLRDKKGRLWFGTNGGGMSCYDGARFTNFSLEQGLSFITVGCMMEDKRGNLWFGTHGGGVSRYDGIRFTTFTAKEGLAGNIVLSMVEDKKGNLWFGTQEGGVSRYDGKKFTTFNSKDGLPSNPVNSIAEDKDGNVWFGTFGGGVSRYNGTSFTTFTKTEGLASNYIWHIFEDANGNLWFGTQENGVSRFDGTSFTTFTTKEGLTNNTVRRIMEDRARNLWFGTLGGGVSRYDGTNFTSFTTEKGLASNNVNSITEDKNGNLWFGTDGGLSCYNGPGFDIFSSDQGLATNGVACIMEDKSGNLWFAPYGSGVCRYDGIYFTTFSANQGLASNIIFSIEKDSKGNIWFGTYEGGVSCYDGKSFSTFTTFQGLGGNTIMDILEDKKGNLWFATLGGGISRFDGKAFTTYTATQGLVNNSARNILEDENGNLWIGTEGGLSRYDGISFTNFTVDQGLALNSIMSSIKDKSGNLWFGTSGGGVSRYDGSGFISLTTQEGLPDGNLYAMVEDDDGVIWMGTNQGFSGLKFKAAPSANKNSEIKGIGLCRESNEQLKSSELVWEIYSNQTGYPVKDLNLGAMSFTKIGLPNGNKREVGIIWGGCGDQKVVRFDPKKISKNSEALAVFIRSIKINETGINWYSLQQNRKDSTLIAQQEAMVYGKSLPVKLRDSLQNKFKDIQFDSITAFYPLPENLLLPYKHNRVSFDFGAMETSRNFMVRYQYALEGYDKEWSPLTEESSATFGNIPEGAYTFKLKARSPDGVWSEPISYSFKVLPPWWRTWWFRAIIGICFLVLLYGIYRWRTAALRKQKRILEQTVKERTAEVVKQKEKSDELLLNILPSEVADELKEKGYTTAKSFDEVTVLFSDIKGFTDVAEKLTAQKLVKEINIYFSAFDNIILKYGLEKIKTIGDAYIAAGGLPEKNNATAQNVIEAAIAMQRKIQELKQERILAHSPYFELRIGIHTGPVVAGVVGIKKFQYDIWGDTVNLAARMEQSGAPGKINISQHTYSLVKEKFNCIYRGKIEAKNKGEIDMYFVE